MKVYVDGVMFLNFLVDFLLLLGTNRVAGMPSDYRRLIAASVLGALYSGVCLLPSCRFMGNLLWRAVCLGLMGSIAYGWNRNALQRCATFLLLSLALGGFAVSLGRRDIPVLLLSALGLWLLCHISFTAAPGSRDYVPLVIKKGDVSLKILALRDTGNTLRDPITGQQVLVISQWAAFQLTGLTANQLQHPLETMTLRSIPGLRLIPFQTVGQGGMMLAMRLEDVWIDGRRSPSLVGFAPENFGRGEAYQALTGGIVSW